MSIEMNFLGVEKNKRNSQKDVLQKRMFDLIKENEELRSQVNILISEREQSIASLRKADKSLQNADKKLDKVLDTLEKIEQRFKEK